MKFIVPLLYYQLHKIIMQLQVNESGFRRILRFQHAKQRAENRFKMLRVETMKKVREQIKNSEAPT